MHTIKNNEGYVNPLFALLHSRWLIEPHYAANAGALVHTLMNGGRPEWWPEARANGQALSAMQGGTRRDISQEQLTDLAPGSIVTIAVEGPLRRADGWCSMGTKSMADLLVQADQTPNVAGIVLEISSPGGTVDGTEHFANTIRRTQKPVFAHVNYAYSAAYWIAAACDQVWMGGHTAEVGSIGTMLSFTDVSKYWEKMGIASHEIYATASTDKNRAMAEARGGNYDPVIEQMLNPVNEIFLARMREYRGLADTEMTGLTYIADKALQLKMADRIGTLEEAVKEMRTFKKKQYMQTNQSWIARTLSALGVQSQQASAEAQAERLIEQEGQRLEQSLGEARAENAQLRTQLQQANDERDAARAALATAEAERDRYRALSEQYGSQPGAMPTGTQAVKSAQAEEGKKLPFEGYDPNAPHNLALNASLKERGLIKNQE